MRDKSVRRVKLQGKYQSRVKHWNGGQYFAWLNLSGVWLEKAGFKQGDHVEITVQQNQLIITKGSHGDQ